MAYEDMMYGDAFSSGLVGGGLAGFFIIFAIFIFLSFLAIYIYISFVYMKIAKKAKYQSPAIAWIPIVGPSIISANLAKMHWWPVLLLIAFPIPFLDFFAGIAFIVFFIIWTWKVFEGFGKPGWWAIFYLITIVWLIMIGIVAFGPDKFDAKKVK